MRGIANAPTYASTQGQSNMEIFEAPGITATLGLGLAALEASSQDLLRGGFTGLKSLVFMGYYRDARTWKVLAYDGPLVGRPENGWTR